MDQGHVGTVRRLLYWPGVEPRRGQFNWAGLDRIVGGLASKGIAMLPVVYGSPRYIARNPNVPAGPLAEEAQDVAEVPRPGGEALRERRLSTGPRRGSTPGSIPARRRCRSATGRSGTSRT